MVSYRMHEDGGQQLNGKDPPAARISSEPWTTDDYSSKGNSTDLIMPPRYSEEPKGPWFAAWCRETRAFVQITAMHGVKRVWEARAWSKAFWGITVLLLGGLLTYQLTLIAMGYFSKPVVSEITFVMADDGLEFPKITICSYNPMRKSYVEKINVTGDFSMRLARYMLLANNDVLNIFGGNDEEILEEDDAELQAYKKAHPGFTINSFYHSAGFECEEVLKMCSFAGREFNCCNYSTSVLSELGLCQVLNLQDSPYAWMRKQTEATETAGLEIILDAHLEEVLDVSLSTDKVFNTQFGNGFKFYIEEPHTTTSKSSQGITVSPGDIVYTSVALTAHALLDTNNWGTCISEWPAGYEMKNKEKYQSTDCQSMCKANFFYDRCTCSPFMYNIEEDFRACTPLEVYRCVKEYIVVDFNQTTEDYVFPECKECVTECMRSQYSTYNSYGRGFSDDALNALVRFNSEWTEEHIKQNFLSMNIFYRDMGYTSYVQKQDATVTATLSDMGGTMGLFLGMSVLTIIESLIYLAKVLWMTVWCPRKRYTADKENENRRDKVETRDVISGLRILGVEQLANQATPCHCSGSCDKDRVIELRISVDELRRQLGISGDSMIAATLISSVRKKDIDEFNSTCHFVSIPVDPHSLR